MQACERNSWIRKEKKTKVVLLKLKTKYTFIKFNGLRSNVTANPKVKISYFIQLNFIQLKWLK